MKSPCINRLECQHIGGYSVVLTDLKNNIYKELKSPLFNDYNYLEEYKLLINEIGKIQY